MANCSSFLCVKFVIHCEVALQAARHFAFNVESVGKAAKRGS